MASNTGENPRTRLRKLDNTIKVNKYIYIPVYMLYNYYIILYNYVYYIHCTITNL